ncbi:MAG: flippase-like domain-containing protein [Planctomycetes bacterium]|nr:flippase-like domain-containing protein [Planctomycetota bacterium]
MSTAKTLSRLVLTTAILTALLVLVTPQRFAADLRGCDWRFLGLAAAQAPLFLACRVYKWRLLEEQVIGSARVGELLPRYLWGMAVGLITPGRVGELARLRAPVLSAAGSGLFFLEKMIEVSCLIGLCALALPVLHLAPPWSLVPIGIGLATVLLAWRRIVNGCITLVGRVLGRPSAGRRREMRAAIDTLRVRGCAVLSLACFLLYIAQACLVLRALGVVVEPTVAFSYPVILVANLVPITIGGYGVREALAIIVLQVHEIPQAKAAASVAVVTFFDLIIPGLVGVVLHRLRVGRSEDSRPETERGATSVPTAGGEWDEFWETRKKRPLGRLLTGFRQRFVTAKLARYIRDNTVKGTLVEAGCGSGEITLRVAAERGDRVVLVDCSRQALATAERLARQYGVDARLVECDITSLSEHVPPARDNVVYNIGVIEHFRDPSQVLREMARVTGESAIAVIPERSAFWLVYSRLARLLGLVPRDFFVQFFSRRRLAALVTDADLHVRWLRTTRVLGLIPYLGVCYSLAPCPQAQELIHERHPRHSGSLGHYPDVQRGETHSGEPPADPDGDGKPRRGVGVYPGR